MYGHHLLPISTSIVFSQHDRTAPTFPMRFLRLHRTTRICVRSVLLSEGRYAVRTYVPSGSALYEMLDWTQLKNFCRRQTNIAWSLDSIMKSCEEFESASRSDCPSPSASTVALVLATRHSLIRCTRVDLSILRDNHNNRGYETYEMTAISDPREHDAVDHTYSIRVPES